MEGFCCRPVVPAFVQKVAVGNFVVAFHVLQPPNLADVRVVTTVGTHEVPGR